MHDSFSKVAPERRNSSTLCRAQGQRRRVMTAELTDDAGKQQIQDVLNAVAKVTGLSVSHYTDPEAGKGADAAKHAASKLLLGRGFQPRTIADATGLTAIEIERSTITGGNPWTQNCIIRRVHDEGIV